MVRAEAHVGQNRGALEEDLSRLMRAYRRWALNYENLRAEVVPGSSPLEPDPLVLALYAELGRRRDSMDTLMWQVPASRWRCRPCYWRSRSLAMESGACTLQPR